MKRIFSLSFFILLAGTILAETHVAAEHHDHAAIMDTNMMNHSMMKPGSVHTPSTHAFLEANHVMHTGMKIDFTGDPDIDFIRGMIPHHQGAIDMANVVHRYGTNGNIKNFASKVIRDQTLEIGYMKRMLGRLEYFRGKSDAKAANKTAIFAQKRADKIMHHGMAIKFSGNADLDFINGMIPHHQGAIDMAKIVLEHGTDLNVRRIAGAIVNAQDSEIYWMNTWKKKLKFPRKIREPNYRPEYFIEI